MWSGLKDIIGFNLSKMVFIDFGCGTGLAILAAMTKPFDKVIGVEVDSVSADMCRKNVTSFESNKPELILSKSTEIHTKDMCDFEYPKDSEILLYMYEVSEIFIYYTVLMKKLNEKTKSAICLLTEFKLFLFFIISASMVSL
jgi:cyclopropane fatty-acyl-phospholipid synthase-like methyltransferase